MLSSLRVSNWLSHFDKNDVLTKSWIIFEKFNCDVQYGVSIQENVPFIQVL